MAKAAPEEQRRLLELQALDSTLNKLTRQAATARNNPDLGSAGARVAEVDGELVRATTELGDLERELTRAEDEVQAVTARLDRDEKRLNSGTGTSKDLTALQHEIVSLTRRRSDLEDVQLEAMERVEAAREVHTEVKERTGRVRAELLALEEARDAELAEVEVRRGEVGAERAELASTFDAGLLGLYERILARRGVGAARLFHGTSEGSGMQLSPGDLADISQATPDDVVLCPDSGCILVRSGEWGN
ncbi:DNA-binding protein [Arthrobacter sp. RIT-PI-e]|uniref:zinc ribbon domain-containing protein n=1 Tax=Arthrobacter sp. RIT-PI-e TaxID=1681197 RepID=UPI000676910A|nr:C4-type zinc ribbon domain-containing protein [Arthrobacter sp. RIT-PI-e]KNC19139.1 DNA-binding protein [Arthrobacter sp. RIT-PI-e]